MRGALVSASCRAPRSKTTRQRLHDHVTGRVRDQTAALLRAVEPQSLRRSCGADAAIVHFTIRPSFDTPRMFRTPDPYRVNVTTGVSERYGAVLFPRKSLLAGTEASTS